MHRDAYEQTATGKIIPLQDATLFSTIRKMESRANMTRAEFEGLDLRAKAAKKTMDGAFGEIHRIIDARNGNVPVYLTKDGKLTTETPAKQQDLFPSATSTKAPTAAEKKPPAKKKAKAPAKKPAAKKKAKKKTPPKRRGTARA